MFSVFKININTEIKRKQFTSKRAQTQMVIFYHAAVYTLISFDTSKVQNTVKDNYRPPPQHLSIDKKSSKLLLLLAQHLS